MKNKFIPYNAGLIPDSKIKIDFAYYNDKECKLDKMSKVGLVKKILKFIKQVGQCQDSSELFRLLKAQNSQDMSSSRFQKMVPEGLKVYEIWHGKNTSERVLYTITGSNFYPVLFLQNHPS